MLSIYDYFQRALRHELGPIRGVPGQPQFDAEGNSARFWLEIDGARIVRARFQCTTCCTLVGLCEHAADLLTLMLRSEAERFSGRHLLVLHPEIPESRRDRSMLVADAIRSAANHAKMEAYA